MKYSEALKLVGFWSFIECDLPGFALQCCGASRPIPWESLSHPRGSSCPQPPASAPGEARLAQGRAGCDVWLVSLQLQHQPGLISAHSKVWPWCWTAADSVHRSRFPLVFGVDALGNTFLPCCWWEFCARLTLLWLVITPECHNLAWSAVSQGQQTAFKLCPAASSIFGQHHGAVATSAEPLVAQEEFQCQAMALEATLFLQNPEKRGLCLWDRWRQSLGFRIFFKA